MGRMGQAITIKEFFNGVASLMPGGESMKEAGIFVPLKGEFDREMLPPVVEFIPEGTLESDGGPIPEEVFRGEKRSTFLEEVEGVNQQMKVGLMLIRGAGVFRLVTALMTVSLDPTTERGGRGGGRVALTQATVITAWKLNRSTQ